LLLPSRDLALMMAAEWDRQGKYILPISMPLVRKKERSKKEKKQLILIFSFLFTTDELSFHCDRCSSSKESYHY
jgi:chaperone required for assembly of F1-ATPase